MANPEMQAYFAKSQAAKFHFCPPLHIKTSACGYTLAEFDDAEARRILGALGIADPEHMTDEQRIYAVMQGWCENCLNVGFTDECQMRGPHFQKKTEASA
jgi:hypothetical protein